MFAFTIFLLVCSVVALVLMCLHCWTIEAKLQETTSERDDLFHRLQQSEFDRDKLSVEVKQAKDNFDYFKRQVDKLHGDCKHCEGGQ